MTRHRASRVRARGAVVLASAALLTATAAACSSSTQRRGTLMVAIDTDLEPGVDFDRLHIEVKINGTALVPDPDPLFKEIGRPGLRRFPVTYALDGNGSPTEVQVRVSTGLADAANTTPVGMPRTLSETLTRVPTDRVALLRMPIQWLCLGSGRALGNYVEGNCPEGTTCVAGECVEWSVDSTKLETYDDAKVFGGGSANGEGTCFDTLGCFAQGAIADVRMSDCTIDLPSGGAGVNVAMVVPKSAAGICDGNTCLVPLMAESIEGWHADGAAGRLRLPPAICAGTKFGQRPSAIAVTTSCAPRVEGVPTCGAWSVLGEPVTKDAGLPPSFSLDARAD